jgi:hypothetical protein
LYYVVFGLALKSNRAIPGLKPLPDLPLPDVEVWLGDGLPRLDHPVDSPPEVWYVCPNDRGAGDPDLQVWKLEGGAYFRLRYWDGVEFVVDRRGTRVWATWPDKASLEEVTFYLLGPILGFLLRLRGLTCLHASAIEVEGYALAFMGQRRAGKSTTAAAFARLGYEVLTDDITALEENRERFWVLPGAPRLCLWPDSVSALFGSPEVLPRLIPEDSVAPEWDKRWLDLTGPEYLLQSQPLPLGAIYLLGERAESGPALETISGQSAFLTLLANTYSYNLVDKALRAPEFEALNRILDQVAVRQVTPHPDPAFLSRMCDLIVGDFCALSLPPISGKAPY